MNKKRFQLLIFNIPHSSKIITKPCSTVLINYSVYCKEKLYSKFFHDLGVIQLYVIVFEMKVSYCDDCTPMMLHILTILLNTVIANIS